MTFVLDATNKAIKFTITAGASSDVHFTSHWADATATGLTEGQTQGTSNGSTAVDAVPAPAASTRRVVKLITFYNTNASTARTVTLVNDVGGTSRTIATFTLAPLATWYSDTASTTAIADGDKGDITVSGSGATWTIDNNAITTAKILDANVTYAKIQDVSATSQVLGRRSLGSGDVEECTLSQVLDFVGSAAQGDILYRGASTWVRLGAGTRGRYLQTGGASANPSWAQAAAFKNVIINGDMQVAQRGTSFTSTGSANNNRAYTLDRWYIQSEGSTATSYGNNIINVDQDTDAPSSTSGLFESRVNSLKMTVVSGNNNRKFGIAQIVEQRNCRHLRGTTVSLSFKAKASASIGNVQAVVLEWTGTADSVNSSSVGNFINTTTTGWNTDGNAPAYVTSISTTNTPSDLGVTTSWASYTIPNITISSSMNNLIVFIFNNDKTTTAGDALWITDVQLEPGPVATEFEYLPIGVQQDLCARYLPRGLWSNGSGKIEFCFGTTNSFDTSQAVILVNYSTRARVAPTGLTFTPSDFEIYDMTTAASANAFGLVQSLARLEAGFINAALYVTGKTAGNVNITFTAGGVCFMISASGTTPRMIFTGCEL